MKSTCLKQSPRDEARYWLSEFPRIVIPTFSQGIFQRLCGEGEVGGEAFLQSV
jgi:hypothetical protein